MISCPESGLQNAPGFRHRKRERSGPVVWQWCSSVVARRPPEQPIPGPNPDETPAFQFQAGCNLQPAPQIVGAAGLLQFDGFKCYKQWSARQHTRPLLVTELYRQKRCPYSGHEIRTSFSNTCLHLLAMPAQKTGDLQPEQFAKEQWYRVRIDTGSLRSCSSRPSEITFKYVSSRISQSTNTKNAAHGGEFSRRAIWDAHVLGFRVGVRRGFRSNMFSSYSFAL